MQDVEGKLSAALAAIGDDPELRAELVRLAQRAEDKLARRDFNVREEISGPLVDAAFSHVDALTVRLDSGLEFCCPYRSRIARDLALRRVEVPDHIFEPQTTKLLLRVSRGAKHVLIGGAYAGDHTIVVAGAIAKHGGIVHAFEPNPELYAMLLENLKRNRLDNVRANRLGLWSSSDARLRLTGGDAWGRVELADGDDAFAAITIDDYGRGAGIAAFDAIMLDIEGAEFDALRGARGYLSQSPETAPKLIYEINRGYVDWTQGLLNTEFIRYLTDLGYTSFGVRDYQDNVALGALPVELVPLDDIYLEGPPHGFNLLGVKDPAFARDPAFRITPGVSPKYLQHRDPRYHAPLPDSTPSPVSAT